MKTHRSIFLRGILPLTFLVSFFACHLNKAEEDQVFSFPSLADSLAGVDHATILLKDTTGRIIDTLFHGPVTASTTFRKLDAPHYEGGLVVIAIEGRRNGSVIYREERTFDGKDGKVIGSVPILLPGSQVKITSLAPSLSEGDSALLPRVEVLPTQLADRAVRWESRMPAIFSANETHLRAHSAGVGYLVVCLASDTLKRDSLWIEVSRPNDPRPGLDSLVLSPDTLVLTLRGPKARFAVRFVPDTAAPALQYQVEDSSLATVSSDGWLTAKSTGFTRLIATSRTQPPRSDSASVRVEPPRKVDSVRFALDSLDLFAQGAAESLLIKVHPPEANPEVGLTVDDPTLVSLNGRVIRGLKDGETWVFARSLENPSQFDSLRVRVRALERVQRVTVNPGSLTLYFRGESGRLSASLTPSSLSQRFLWRSSVPQIVGVDTDGKVTPGNPGSGFIIVMAGADTTKRDSALVTVKKDVPRLSAGRDTVIAVGRTVAFPLLVTQEYGSIVMHKWDLDGNGVYDDSSTTLKTDLAQSFLEAREHLVRFYVRDIEGNDTVVIRKVTAVNGPVIQFHAPLDGAHVNRSPVEVTWSVDGVRQAANEPLTEGANTITRSAKDAAGNSYSATLTLHLDTRSPVVEISEPTANTQTRLTHIPVAWTVDGKVQTTRTTEPLGGKHGRVSIVRDWTDSAGNRGADTVFIVRDTLAPGVVTFISPTSPSIVNASHTEPVQWAWTRTGEPSDFFLVSLNGAPPIRQAGASYLLPNSTNLTFSLEVLEIDAAGNMSQAASRSVTVDRTLPPAPSVTGVSPTGTPSWTWSPGAGSDGSRIFRYKYSTESAYSSEGTTTSFTPAGLGSGTHTLLVQERDAAGNWSTDGSHSIVVDRSGPILSVSTPSERGRVANFNPQVTGNVIDGSAIRRVEYRIKSSTYATATRTGADWSFSGIYDVGANPVWVRSEDEFGNRDSITFSIYKYPNVVFVRKGATGIGKSWEDAIGEIYTALDSTKAYPIATEIWVTRGSYSKPPGDDDNIGIYHSNLKVVGGFFESHPSTDSTQRDLAFGATNIEPLFGNPVDGRPVDLFSLDGFTLLGGLSVPANGSRIRMKNIIARNIHKDGGGIIGSRAFSLIMENCEFTNLSSNEGAALYFTGHAELVNCRITGNSSPNWVSPVEIGSSTTVHIRSSHFENNRGSGSKLYHFDLWYSGQVLDIDDCRIQGGQTAIYRDGGHPIGDFRYGSGNSSF